MSTFDDKVYEIIKNEAGLYDELFPVGSVVKRKSRTPPGIGTWKIIGVYGSKSYTEVPYNGVFHNIDFNGNVATDTILIEVESRSSFTFTYDKFDLSRITVPDLFISTTSPNTTGSIVDSAGNTVTISIDSFTITITKTAGQPKTIYAIVRLDLKDDETFTGSFFDGLSFEFERTA